MIAALILTAMLVATSSASIPVQLPLPWPPLNVEIEVTEVKREHGIFVDKWSFAALVTNPNQDAINVMFTTLHTDYNSYYGDDCIRRNITTIAPDTSQTLRICGLIPKNETPTEITMSGGMADDTYAMTRGASLPFIQDECIGAWGDHTCLPAQDIDDLIENVEFEPLYYPIPEAQDFTGTTHNTTRVNETGEQKEIDRADTIIIGVVVGVDTYWVLKDMDMPSIMTRYQMGIEEILKGYHNDEDVDVLILGGKMDRIEHITPSIRLNTQDKVLLMLGRNIGVVFDNSYSLMSPSKLVYVIKGIHAINPYEEQSDPLDEVLERVIER